MTKQTIRNTQLVITPVASDSATFLFLPLEVFFSAEPRILSEIIPGFHLTFDYEDRTGI